MDTADKMCATFNVAQNTRHWPMVVFFTKLNVAGINSQFIYIGYDVEASRRVFLKQLSHELVVEETGRSMKMIGMPLDLQMRLQ